jgi:large subunit ribosomal protein L30
MADRATSTSTSEDLERTKAEDGESTATTAAAEEGKSASKSKSKSKSSAGAKQLRITQVRSGNGRPRTHRATLAALGLKRHQHSVVQNDNPAIRGMVFQVRHLVEVEELEGEE